MESMEQFYKAVLDRELAPVVLCDVHHTVLYMNNAAISRYADRGGAELVGKNLLRCHSLYGVERINRVVEWFQESKDHNVVYTFRNEREDKDVYMLALRDGEGELIGYYEKHAFRTRETMPLYDLE